MVPAAKIVVGMKFTITKAEVKTTQYSKTGKPDLAVFETKELGNVKSFNQAILTDALDIIEGKIALPKAVEAVNVKSKTSGRTYIALQEA